MRTRLILALLFTLAGCLEKEDIYDEKRVAPSAVYRIASTIEVPAPVAAPGEAATALELARRLETDPADTLFALAERAGVPAVATLRDALPDALETRLEAAIDAHVDDFLRANPDVAAGLALAVDTADTVLGEIALTSELVIGTTGRGQHRLLTIGFAVDGAVTSIDVAGAPFTSAIATVATYANVEDAGWLELGDHGFGLPVGSYALPVIDAALERRVGADLRTLLGDAADCAGMAADVADECVLGACIGHEAELLDLCEAALDRLVDELGDRVAGADRDVLHLGTGSAQMTDRDGDGRAEELSGGVWQSRIDLGTGPRTAPGRFATVPAPGR
jgi:hypothetical protein